MDVHVWAVALREFGLTLAPAVVVLAVELSLSVTGDVAEGSLYKAFPQVTWEDQLQTCKSSRVLVLSSGRGSVGGSAVVKTLGLSLLLD